MTGEAELYGPICLALSRAGHRAFRNHVGVAQHADGARTVRHGLPPGSSDLIGWTADGRFLAIEVKPPGWRLTPSYERSERGRRQVAFLASVTAAGGVAGFVRSVDEALALVSAVADRAA